MVYDGPVMGIRYLPTTTLQPGSHDWPMRLLRGKRFPLNWLLLGPIAGVCLLGAFFAVLTPSGFAQAGSAQISDITSALRTKQFDQALQLLGAQLKQDPRNPRLWTLEGIAYSGKQDKKQALSAFQHALTISGDYLPALEGAAQIEYETGGKGAEQLLRHVTELRPDDVTAHAMLAVLDYRRDDCAAALPHFEKSASLLDAQPEAMRAYAGCLVKLKEFDKAIPILQQAVEKNPDDKNARYRLASVDMMAQKPKAAIDALSAMLQADPDARTLQLAAAAYEANGDTPQAVQALRQAIVANPHDVDLYLDFAGISMDHQSYQVGVDVIDAGLSAEPKSAPLYVARGVLYVQLAQYDKAEADFAKADELDPRRALGAAAEGLEAQQQNDPDKALVTVKAKLTKKPNDAFLLYLQADILTQKGPETGSPQFRQAVESAKKAIALQPSLFSARDVLAKLYLQSGENQAAIEQCRKALQSDPKDQSALYHLIQALRKSGQTEGLPDLLKQLAQLREQSTKDEQERNRYKLVENETQTAK
jgi:tetratricopeptide (TPR) repeat protein